MTRSARYAVKRVLRGASVAQVARRYAVNANLIHKWLWDPRFSRETERVAALPAVDGFLRVEIEDAEVIPVSTSPVVLTDAAQAPLRATRVGLTLNRIADHKINRIDELLPWNYKG